MDSAIPVFVIDDGRLRNAKGEPIFLYDRHMPLTDDLELIVLKGHLLVEETMMGLASAICPQPDYLIAANLSFHKLANITRAIVPDRSEDVCWELILKLNGLRNDMAHKLSSPQRHDRILELFEIDRQSRQNLPLGIHEDDDEQLISDPIRLRMVVQTCMTFLLMLDFHYQEGKIRQG